MSTASSSAGDAVDDDGALPDGLEETGQVAPAHEPVEQPQRGCRLAAVLPRGGEVQLAHRATAGGLG